MDGIFYNGLHSFNNMNLTRIDTRKVSPPSKIKTKQTIPFSSLTYDFSNLYGSNVYEERLLQYDFLVDARGEDLTTFEIERNLEVLKMQVENWLLGSNGKSRLDDDNLVGFYYMAECESIDWKHCFSMGIITVNFIAYPFKLSAEYDGNNLWDTFNFELDCLQDTKFDVSGSKSVKIYNSSAIDVEPLIVCNSNFEIVKDGKVFKVSQGESKDYRFRLSKGYNNLTLKGNGSIEFRYRKEVL